LLARWILAGQEENLCQGLIIVTHIASVGCRTIFSLQMLSFVKKKESNLTGYFPFSKHNFIPFQTGSPAKWLN
jgi:hypothetical protein